MHVRPTIFSYKQHLGETSLRARHHRGKSPTPQRAKYISVPCQLQTMAAAQKILFTQTLRCSDDNMEMIQKECCLKITKAFSVSDVILIAPTKPSSATETQVMPLRRGRPYKILRTFGVCW